MWICEGLEGLDVDPQQEPEQVDCEMNSDPQVCLGDTDNCVYQAYHGVEHLHEFALYGPNNDLWVSQIVEGKDAQHGLITPIGIPQSPRTFSVSLENINGSPVGVMAEPTLSSYREALKGILDSDVNGATPANISLKIKQIYSMSSLQNALKINLDWPGGSFFSEMFKANFAEQNVFVADLAQSYYSVTFDAEGMPADYLRDDLSLDDVQGYFPSGSSPLLINRINYGRRAIVSIKSNASSSEMQLAIKTAFDYVVKGDIDVSVKHQKILNTAEIEAFILGDGGQQAILAISGFDGFLQFLAEGGNYDSEHPGAPISYGYTNLKNKGQQFALTTDFAEATCSDEVKVRVKATKYAVLKDAEGSGKSEMKWWGKVTGNNGLDCTLINQKDIVTLKAVYEKSYEPPGECVFSFPTDQPMSFTITHWSGEFTKGGSLETEASDSQKYTYDPEDGTFSPPLGGYMIEAYKDDWTDLHTRMWGQVSLD